MVRFSSFALKLAKLKHAIFYEDEIEIENLFEIYV